MLSEATQVFDMTAEIWARQAEEWTRCTTLQRLMMKHIDTTNMKHCSCVDRLQTACFHLDQV
jgi:hypothetical protein